MDEIFEEIGRLTGPMLKRSLYVALAGPTEPDTSGDREPVDALALLPEHLRYLIGLEQRGVLFAAGPFLQDGEPGDRSMYVLRAESADEARAIMADEPLHKHGLRASTIQEWSLNEGRISVSVDFSSQRAGVDGPPANDLNGVPA